MTAAERDAAAPARSRAGYLFRGGSGRDLVLLLLVGLALFGAGLGLRDPWPPDEPRFALVGREMAESGDWLFPHRNGELYPDKPPVFMWLVGAGYLVTGKIRIAFLLPSLIAGLGTVLVVYDAARRLWNRRVALVAGIALLATMQFVLQARTGQIDALLTLWTTLALYGLLRHLVLGPSWRWWTAAFVAMGLGVVTKGVGALPGLVLAPYAWARIRGWPLLPRFRWSWWRTALGPAAMLAVVGAWLVPMLAAVAASGDPALAAYRDNILLKQTAERYVAAWHHERWFGYYLLQVAPWAWLPLSFALPWLIPGWSRRLRRREPRTLLLVGWVLLVLLFFSVSPGKRGVYILPAAPALVLAAAPLLPGLLRRRGARATARAALVGLAGVFAALGATILAAPGPVERALTHYRGEASVVALPLFLLGALGLALAAALPRRPVLTLVAFLWSMWMIVGWWVYPALNPVRSAAPLMAEVEGVVGPNAALGIVDWREQFVLFADLPVTTFGYARSDLGAEAAEAAAWAVQEGARPRWVMVPDEVAAPCFDRTGALDLGVAHGHDWLLAPATAVTPACAGGS